ncbi:hypothetical protein [Candidatus Hodgkinia cicadicola]
MGTGRSWGGLFEEIIQGWIGHWSSRCLRIWIGTLVVEFSY